MEQPLITAVTHSTSEARVTLDGRARRRRARRRASSRRWREANVNVDMIVQNEPVVGGGAGGDLLHGAARGSARGAPRRSSR